MFFCDRSQDDYRGRGMAIHHLFLFEPFLFISVTPSLNKAPFQHSIFIDEHPIVIEMLNFNDN
jgi:hypothetical protein